MSFTNEAFGGAASPKKETHGWSLENFLYFNVLTLSKMSFLNCFLHF